MIPVTYWVIEAMGISQDVAIRMAFGTSLMVSLPTAISGAWKHSKNKAVRWKVALVLGSCGLAGALVGATLAAHLPGEALKVGFGGLVLAIALWMGVGERIRPGYSSPDLPQEERNKAGEPRENLGALAACGFPIGIVTGLSGLGGGSMIVPLLLLAFGFPMRIAIGTSVASIIFTSLGGAIGYIINGIGAINLLPHSIGYVNLPIWLCLAATSIPMAQLGARTAHALPAERLKYAFIAVMVYLGLRMIGLF